MDTPHQPGRKTIVAGVGEWAGTTRQQWFLIVAIAAGLIGMHHLVHIHSGHPMPVLMATGPGPALMSPTPTEHVHFGPIDVSPVGARSTSVVAAQPWCCEPMEMMGHFCMAVLTALTALTAALILAAAWRRPWELGHLLAGVRALAARSPPIGSVQFTQLCVLRR